MCVKSVVALVCACFVSGVAVAESLELVDVFVLARTNDPTTNAARSEYEAILQTVPEARGLYLPNVRFTADFTETEQTINSSDNQVFGSGTSSFPTDVLSLSLSQPIFRYEYIMRMRQARAGVLEAGVRTVAAEQDLILQSAIRYLELLAAKDNLEYSQAQQDANKLQLDQIVRRKEVGFANSTEVYESRARFEFSRSVVAEASSHLEDQLDALAELIGERPEDISPLSDRIPHPPPDPNDVDQWIAKAIDGNLSLQARLHGLEVSSYEIRRQRAGAFPTLDLFINGEQRTTEGSLFGGGSDVSTTDILLRLEVPIFQGGQVRARRKGASYRYEQAQHFAEQERRSVRRQTRAAFLGVVNGVIKVEALEQSLKSQELTVASKQKGFVAGTNTNLEVLDALRDQFLVRRDHAKARYDYLTSLLTLKSLVGSLSFEDLEEINRYLSDAA